jgi:uncharacterized protein (TIGR03086 family)
MSQPGPLEDLDSALAGAETIVAGIGHNQWASPTPCTGLDVRALVNHLVSGNLLFAALASGTTRPGRGADLLGDDPVASFREAGARLRAAFAAPGVLDEVYTAPFGTAPGAVLVQVRVQELLGHGWDLARATGQPADFPADVTERALTLARLTLRSRPEGPGAPFGPEKPVPDSATPIDRLAAFLGRQV